MAAIIGNPGSFHKLSMVKSPLVLLDRVQNIYHGRYTLLCKALYRIFCNERYQVGVQTRRSPTPHSNCTLSQEHLNLVNSAMNRHSQTKRWHALLQTIGLVPMVLRDVPFCSSTTFQSTSLHNRVVAPQAIRPAGWIKN